MELFKEIVNDETKDPLYNIKATNLFSPVYIKTSGMMVTRIFAILGLLLIGTCYGGSYPNSYPKQNDMYFPTFGSSAVIYLHLLCSMIFDLQGLLTYLNINLFELMKG